MEKDTHKITQTLLVLALASVLIHVFFVEHTLFLYFAIVLIILALVPQFILGKLISSAWLKFGEAMSWVMSKIILGLLFYLFVFPLSSLYKLFNKDLLMLKKKKDSYYVIRNHLFTKKDIQNPW